MSPLKNLLRSFLFGLIWVSASASAYDVELRAPVSARFDKAISKQGYPLGVGSPMTVFYDRENSAEGVFLGLLVSMEGATKSFMFYDYAAAKAFIFDIRRSNLEYAGKAVGDDRMQAIAEPIEQYDNTCSAFAVVYFLRQLDLNGFRGTGALAKMLGSREGVTRLMARALNDYYLNPRTASFQVVYRKLSEEVGMKCRKVTASTPERFVELLEAATEKGSPVLLEFYIGPEMITTDVQFRHWDKSRGEDRRLWIPRKTGERESGGHAIVLDAFFVSPSGRLKALVGDSDWQGAPRIWDIQNYLMTRIESGAISAHVCFAK